MDVCLALRAPTGDTRGRDSPTSPHRSGFSSTTLGRLQKTVASLMPEASLRPPNPSRSRYLGTPFGSLGLNSPFLPTVEATVPHPSRSTWVASPVFCVRPPGLLRPCPYSATQGLAGSGKGVICITEDREFHASQLRTHSGLLQAVQRRRLSGRGMPQPKPGRHPKCPAGLR